MAALPFDSKYKPVASLSALAVISNIDGPVIIFASLLKITLPAKVSVPSVANVDIAPLASTITLPSTIGIVTLVLPLTMLVALPIPVNKLPLPV